MPTFATPAPVRLRVTIDAGDITIEASERTDTDIEVAPADPSNPTDVEGAEQTRVEQRIDTIVVEAPRHHGVFRRSPELLVRVRLPEGSHLDLTTSSADLRATGRLGTAEIKTASGDIRLDAVQRLRARSASGDVWCGRVEQDASGQAASGDVGLDSVGGRAELRSASGDIRIREVGGDLQVQTASGDIRVDAADGSVRATTASGEVLLGSVRRGRVSADAASGELLIGVAEGTAAWLDLSSLSGDVSSALNGAEAPGEAEESVEIRARTVSGDISIVRAGDV